MRSPVVLIPWDPTDAEHFNRIDIQQSSLAWFPVATTRWAEEQASGIRNFYFVALLPDHPAYASLHAAHTAKYPTDGELMPSSHGPVLPVGHLALGPVLPGRHQFLKMAEGPLVLSSLYVSWPLHGTGVGAAALDAANDIARASGAPSTVLETITTEWQSQEAYLKQMYDDRDLPRPGRSNEDWYAKRGYKQIPGSKYTIDTGAPDLTGDLAKVELVWMERKF